MVKSRKYRRRWRRAYKRYFRKFRPRKLAVGKSTSRELVAGVSECEVMTTIPANASVGNETFTVTPFYHNFVGFGEVVNQPYGICGAYGNEALRVCFARYQQVRVKGMYIRVRIESVHTGTTSAATGYLDVKSFNNSYTPFVVWDRQGQLKDVDDRDYYPEETVSSAASQGMPLWYNKTTDVWEAKCLPKDIGELASWIDTTTSYSSSGGSDGQRPLDWYTNTAGTLKYDYMCQTNYYGNNSLARTIPPPQFNPLARIVIKSSPLTIARDVLVRVSAKYYLEFRNPGAAQTDGVRLALYMTDVQLAPHNP